MAITSKHEISAHAAGKHMTLDELEAFCHQARANGAAGDATPKARTNTFAETIRRVSLEYDSAPAPDAEPGSH